MVNLTIDNVPVSVKENTTIMEAAAGINIEIPKLCFLKGLNEKISLSSRYSYVLHGRSL